MTNAQPALQHSLASPDDCRKPAADLSTQEIGLETDIFTTGKKTR